MANRTGGTRTATLAAAVLMGVCASCSKDPGPWKIERVEDRGSISVARKNEGTYVTLAGIDWPPERLPTAHAAAEEVKRLGATGAITPEWSGKASSGPGRLVIGGRDVGEALIAAGLARAAAGAPASFASAEATARASKLGGWSEAGRAEILRWLRGEALRVKIFGGGEGVRFLRAAGWRAARDFAAKDLAFFEVKPGEDFGPPACVDRLAEVVLPKLRAPATPDDVKRAFAPGRTLVSVPASGPAQCVAWTVGPKGELAREDTAKATVWTRGVQVVADAAAVVWTSEAEKSASVAGGPAGSSGSSGQGRESVTAASEDTLVIGGATWFTGLAACERELAAAFPKGCEEP